jgi:hypothetical protein
MNQQVIERRRLLRLFMLGSIAVPAVALAGCAQGTSGRPARPPRRYGGGNNGGEKSGGGGGLGGRR